MGQSHTIFSDEELRDYEELTYFSRSEVLRCFSKFNALAPEIVDHDRNARLPMEIMLRYPALKVNPFGDRLCTVFSSTKDGDCTFDDFLDMMSVFNDRAPFSVKAEYAFRIYDFDGDDMLGPEDLEEIIRRIVGDDELPHNDIAELLEHLNSEADLDDDGMISFAEFENVMSGSKEFINAFRMHLDL